jgi:hypothetical protein
MPVNFRTTLQRYIPEDTILHKPLQFHGLTRTAWRTYCAEVHSGNIQAWHGFGRTQTCNATRQRYSLGSTANVTALCDFRSLHISHFLSHVSENLWCCCVDYFPLTSQGRIKPDTKPQLCRAGNFQNKIYYNIIRLIQNKTNSVALSPREKLYRLSDRHLSTKFSANFCG